MIEFEHDRIAFTAVETGMRPKVVEYESLSLPNTLRLKRVASLPVMISLLGVVRLETVATPPLEA
jgi:hypothetical protein